MQYKSIRSAYSDCTGGECQLVTNDCHFLCNPACWPGAAGIWLYELAFFEQQSLHLTCLQQKRNPPTLMEGLSYAQSLESRGLAGPRLPVWVQ